MEAFIWLLVLIIIIFIAYDRFCCVINNNSQKEKYKEGFTAQKFAEVKSFYDGNNLTTKKLEIGQSASLGGNVTIKGNLKVDGNVNLNNKKIMGQDLTNSKELNDLIKTLEKEINKEYLMVGKPYFLINNGQMLGWFPGNSRAQVPNWGYSRLPGSNGYVRANYLGEWPGRNDFGIGDTYSTSIMAKPAGDINKLKNMPEAERRSPMNLINSFIFY